MKKLWVRADGNHEWDRRKKLVTTALECGAEAVLVRKGESEKARGLGRILTISPDDSGDIHMSGELEELARSAKKKAFYKEIKSKADEKDITSVGGKVDYVVVKASDWKVIPLENIIASLKGKAKIIVEVSSKEDARLSLETLEIGADGVLVDSDPGTIKKVSELIAKSSSQRLELKVVRIKSIKQIGMGDRVCIDTCTMLKVGEGMLIGSQSSALFLVHSESVETEYVAARPFRVNAGPVHAYIRMPDGGTKYLSELSSGDEVLAVDCKGNTQAVVIGRLKIEKRPLLLVEAESDGKTVKSILQNAETIRLIGKDCRPVSITALKEGDEVLAFIESAGRHFGMKVEETIEEK